MQTSLARRQRHRRAVRPPADRRGGSTLRRILIAIPIIILVVGMLAGRARERCSRVAAYNYYAPGLPDPKEALDRPRLRAADDRLRPDRQGRARPPRRAAAASSSRSTRSRARCSTRRRRSRTRTSGSTPASTRPASSAPAIDTLTGRPRGASTITQQLVRARLLPAERLRGHDLRAQDPRDHPVDPPDPGLSRATRASRRSSPPTSTRTSTATRSYGVKAAAKGYFGKKLEDLTLAEVRDPRRDPAVADEVRPRARTPRRVCRRSSAGRRGGRCGRVQGRPARRPGHDRDRPPPQLHPRPDEDAQPADRRAAHRRPSTRRPRREPVVLAPQSRRTWRAPHFVWQVREAARRDPLPGRPRGLRRDRHRRLPRHDDARLGHAEDRREVGLRRGPCAPRPRTRRPILERLKIPRRTASWILGLRGKNIHNGAAAVIDYRTGEVLAYVGSASYTAKGTKKFQPQFDVLADGWRQPGSAIKPINYAIGIDDQTMTAATMFMDVTTDFGGGFTPTQADDLERGPVRLRCALQFSLNIPAIKADVISGLDHFFERSQGLRHRASRAPRRRSSRWASARSRSTRSTCSGLRHDRQRRRAGCRARRSLKVVDEDGKQVWPLDDAEARGRARSSARRPPTSSPTSWRGNTEHRRQPVLGRVRDLRRWRCAARPPTRPARRTTTATSTPTATSPRPRTRTRPALAVGVWMGNSNNEPNKGSLSLDSSAPLWSAILEDVSKDLRRSPTFRAPDGPARPRRRRVHRPAPGRSRRRPSRRCSCRARCRRERDTIASRSRSTRRPGYCGGRAASGPKITRGFLDLREVEATIRTGRRPTAAGPPGRPRGAGVRGGPERAPKTRVLLRRRFYPFGRTWGGAVRADARRARSPATVRVGRSATRLTTARPADAIPCPTRPMTSGRRAAEAATRRQAAQDAQTLTDAGRPSGRSPLRG